MSVPQWDRLFLGVPFSDSAVEGGEVLFDPDDPPHIVRQRSMERGFP